MNCENCQTSLKEDQNYCFQCGAKVIRNRLTVKNLSTDVSEQFLDYDNALFKTVRDLTIKPHVVINSFISGTRKKYLNVIQYFAISLTILGIQVFVLKTFFPEFLNAGISPEDLEKMPEGYKNFMANFFDYQSLFYTITLPLVALASWLVFITNKLYNYTEHLVINLYITAHYLVVSTVLLILFAVLGVNFSLASFILTVPFFIYNAWIFKKLYKLSFWETAARGFLIFVLYCAILFAIIVLLGILWIIYVKLTGGTLPTTTIN